MLNFSKAHTPRGFRSPAWFPIRKVLTACALLAVSLSATANPDNVVVVVANNGMYCAGVAIDEARVVTNRHCTDKASSVTIRTRDGKEHRATVSGQSDKADIALLSVPSAALTPATLGTLAGLKVGSPVTAVGHPQRRNWTSSAGAVIGMAQVANSAEAYLLHSAQTDAGNSGGALFDAEGRLIGIQTGAHKSGSLAVPINLVMSELAL